MKKSLPISLAVTSILASLAVLLFTHITATQARSSDDPGASQSGQDPSKRYAERLEPFLVKTMHDDNIPGFAIGIVENGQLVYSRGFGVMKAGEPARLEYRPQPGSAPKLHLVWSTGLSRVVPQSYTLFGVPASAQVAPQSHCPPCSLPLTKFGRFGECLLIPRMLED
jgi:hypothetical protein